MAYLTNLALLRISEGDSESALPLIEEAVMLVDELKNLQVYMVCTISYLQDSIMALQRHRPEDSRISVWLKKTSRFASRCAAGYPIALPRKLLGKGYRALLSEQGTEAVEHWQAAAKHAKQLDIPFDEAQAYFNLSRSQSVPSLDREEAAEHSKRILSELNIEIPRAWLL